MIYVHCDAFMCIQTNLLVVIRRLLSCNNKYFTVIIYAYNTIIIVLEENTGRDRNKRCHWPKIVSNGVVFVGPYFPEGCLHCQLNFEIIIIPVVVRNGWRTLLIAVTRRSFIGVHVW